MSDIEAQVVDVVPVASPSQYSTFCLSLPPWPDAKAAPNVSSIILLPKRCSYGGNSDYGRSMVVWEFAKHVARDVDVVENRSLRFWYPA